MLARGMCEICGGKPMQKSILTTGTLALALAAATVGYCSSAAARDWDNEDRGTRRQYTPSQNQRPTDNRQRSNRDSYGVRGAPKNYRDQTMQDWSVHYNEQHPNLGPD
jgi:hypothetical protein